MNFEQKKIILEKIKEYEKIIIFRHSLPDGDAVGSTMGLREIIRLTFPEKEVYLSNVDRAEYIEFLGDDSAEIPDEVYAGALGIVIDTAVTARISSRKFSLCRELVKIDHHIAVESYADFEWVEEERSSASEMIADFYRTFREELKINREAATYIYTGMVTDSGRFRYDSTSAHTFRLAAFLMENNIDTNEIFLNLYANDFEQLKLKAQYVLKIQFTARNVAYIYTTLSEMQQLQADTFSISRGMVGCMADIKGVDIWVNFTETERGVLCELRSSRFNINPIAVKYGGGGHMKASGATVKDRETAMQMLSDLDEMMGGK